MYSNFVKIAIYILTIFLFFNVSKAHDYWQQRVVYEMEVDFDVNRYQFKGSQSLKYYNNSPDTLYRVFYHLYLNVFQPGSMMDVRSRTIADADVRVQSRIASLEPDEIGYQKVRSLKQNGTELTYQVEGTILEVELENPLPPGSSSTFEMNFEAQVPLQIRRTGRNSLGGIDYSMSQWFPKMAEYDEKGWHAHPYVAREFYAPWGDYSVKITIDKNYVLAGTGIVQNPNEVGHGYEDEGVKVKHKKPTITWHFKAENVHDFVWAADPDYKHTTIQVPDGPLVRFFYLPNKETLHWEDLPEYTSRAFQYLNENFGKYGWEEYSIIQAGDGGMEYPMATLIANQKTSGLRSLKSLVGVMLHEVIHSWYQGMMATNESYYAWMDEGFTEFVDSYAGQYIWGTESEMPLASRYRSYYRWVNSGLQEPLSTHADHFKTNYAYSTAAYTKGAVSLEQLGYIIGAEARDKGLLRYHKEWAFKHPDLNDFIRVMEKTSGLELDWYYEYWINTTETIDYSVSSVSDQSGKTEVELSKIQHMPMPLDVHIYTQDGGEFIYYIPLGLMRGEKPNETELKRIIGNDWLWTHPTYTFELDLPIDEISSIQIDPSGRMADIDQQNNTYTIGQEETIEEDDASN